jgi:hypothetical protein
MARTRTPARTPGKILFHFLSFGQVFEIQIVAIIRTELLNFEGGRGGRLGGFQTRLGNRRRAKRAGEQEQGHQLLKFHVKFLSLDGDWTLFQLH